MKATVFHYHKSSNLKNNMSLLYQPANDKEFHKAINYSYNARERIKMVTTPVDQICSLCQWTVP